MTAFFAGAYTEIARTSMTLDLERRPEVNFDNSSRFLDAIGRSELKNVITPRTPWADFTLEMYLEDHGIIGGGGLGMVKGDAARQVEKLNLPFNFFTLFYPIGLRRVIDNNFYQQDVLTGPISPQELGFEKGPEISLRANSDYPEITLYKIPNLPVYVLYEFGLQYLYPGGNNIDHRLYQQAVLGFGGYKACKELGINPSVFHVDEAAAAFAELAYLDDVCASERSIEKAREIVRSKSLFTNHTNVLAAMATFSSEQYRDYVMPNLQTSEVRNWLGELIDAHGGRLNPIVLALGLSGELNGVSRVHAEAASRLFMAEHKQVTNGIFFEKWVMPELLRLYRDGIIDRFDLPEANYKQAIIDFDPKKLRKIKDEAGEELRRYLTTRQDQYGRPIEIDDRSEIGCWSKRIAGYKRPGMIFRDPARLASVLQEWDFHLILSGNAHPEDTEIKRELQRILWMVHENEVLRSRVHYVQGYDGDLAVPLVRGAGICFNTPAVWDEFGNRINTEADGTFWKKALANLAVLITTRDGGVADVEELPCFEVTGRDDYEETVSLYDNFKSAAAEVRNGGSWERRVKNQLSAYMPTLSGSRMLRDYLELRFPQRLSAQAKAT